MTFLTAAVWKDIRRRLADPAAQLIWIGLPVVFGGMMSLVIGDSGPAPKAHLLVVDEDRSFLSGLVGAAGRQGRPSAGHGGRRAQATSPVSRASKGSSVHFGVGPPP